MNTNSAGSVLIRRVIERTEDGPVYGLFDGDKQVATISKAWSRGGSWSVNSITRHSTLAEATDMATRRYFKYGDASCTGLYRQSRIELAATGPALEPAADPLSSASDSK